MESGKRGGIRIRGADSFECRSNAAISGTSQRADRVPTIECYIMTLPGGNSLGPALRFERRILEAEEFVRRSRTARHATASRGALTTSQTEWALEMSALKLVVASERFFETTMALYVLGSRSPGRYRPHRLRRISGTVVEVCGIFTGDQEFIGWNDPSVMIRRAERWFRNGEPFQTTLSGASRILAYLKKMRNAIAHQSRTSQEAYVKETRKLYGALPRWVLPGAQLQALPPRSIPYLTGASLFESAVDAYRSIAEALFPRLVADVFPTRFLCVSASLVRRDANA